MASYINITLDNTGVTPRSVKINGDETKTTTTAVRLQITLNEADMQYADSYEMWIHGDVVGTSDSEPTWEKFTYEKNIVLEEGDGEKIVYVRIRDDLHNEGEEKFDYINLYTSVPTVSVSGPTIGRISINEGKNITSFTFTADKTVSACKIMVVENINVHHDDATNHMLEGTNGSTLTAKIGGQNLESSDLHFDFDSIGIGSIAAGEEFAVKVNGLDLYDISRSDGVKIIKVFVKEQNGNWSV